MDQPVSVSVCIPTYNGAEFIADAIQSVLTQSWENFELLVVDDGSSDATVDIARSFPDSRVRIYQNEKHLGIPGNWNRCLSLATEEFVCLFHQDDVMLSKNLEHKVQLLASDPTLGFVHSAVEVVRKDSAPTPIGNWVEEANQDFVVEGDVYFRKLFFRGNLICAPAVVARRRDLLDLDGFDEELGYAPDYEMWMKVCVEHRMGFLCQPLIQYRWHDKNASHAYQFERGMEEMRLARHRAVQYYVGRTGRQQEGEILTDAVAALARLEHWTVELERARQWLEEQKENWQQKAQLGEEAIRQQRGWVTELERGKAWLEEQRTNWQQIAEEQAKKLQEQQAWTAELESGKAWLEEQWRFWQAEAAQGQTEAARWQTEAARWQAEVTRWQAEATRWQTEAARWRVEATRRQAETTWWRESPWVRFGLQLRILRPPKPGRPGATEEMAGDKSSKS